MREDDMRALPPARHPDGRNGERPISQLPPVWTARRPRPKPLYIRSKTPRRVRKAVTEAVARQQVKPQAPKTARVWLPGNTGKLAAGYQAPVELLGSAPPDLDQNLPVVRAMPRRVQAKAETLGAYTRPQMHLAAAPKVGPITMLRRLGVWIGAILYFVIGNVWDKIRRRDTQARRAVRLRQTFERAGGTLVKIGQQMASRLDLLPLRYCEELSAMLDRFPPFPTEQAIAVIERTTGKKLDEIFSTFDPEPIGSASIACVYQAVLRETGEKVAVKVRRPGIRQLFEIDFRVLDVLGGLGEALTLIRSSTGRSVRDEFRNALASELDFRREARIQEIFERRARKANIRFFSAPKIYPEYCNDEVITQEFVSGMWMYEVLAGVEQNDPIALARMAELNIDSKKLARRLLFMNIWGVFESLAFHADPHPANIVVRANSTLAFIDFGAAGYLDQPRRDLYARMYESYHTENVWEMARMGMALNEPLPALDVNLVTRDVEKTLHNLMLAIKSKSAPWYERTSASAWIAALRIIAKHHVTTPPDLLMYARSTLLYDTLAARLDPTIDFYKVGMRYFKWAKRRSQKRGKKALRRLLRRGLVNSIDFHQVGRTVSTFNNLIFRVQRLLSVPYDFTMLPFVIEKWIYMAMMVIRFFTQGILITGLAVGVDVLLKLIQGRNILISETLRAVVQSPIYQIIVIFLVITHVRLILFRLEQKTQRV